MAEILKIGQEMTDICQFLPIAYIGLHLKLHWDFSTDYNRSSSPDHRNMLDLPRSGQVLPQF